MELPIVEIENGFNNEQTMTSIVQYKSSLVAQFKGHQDNVSNSNKSRYLQRQQQTTQNEDQNKRNEMNKLKYRKLKQRLQNLCWKHEQFYLGKQITSLNKPRIMKLSIQLQKQVNNQIKDFVTIENIMRDFLKQLQQKKQNDLHILRQSKFIPSIMELFKKLLSSHKNQYRQSIKIVQLSNKILNLFCTISFNRQYMITTNRIRTIIDLIKWFFNKKQQITQNSSFSKILSAQLNILSNLFQHKLQTDSNQIIKQSIQYIFFSQIIKKIKLCAQSLITEDGITDQILLKSISRFFNSIFHNIISKQSDNIDSIQLSSYSQNFIMNLQLLYQFSIQIISQIIFDKQNIIREVYLPNCTISILIYNFSSLNICSRISYSIMQKYVDNIFIQALFFLIRYTKQQFDKDIDIEILLDQIIITIGYLSLQNKQIQTKISKSPILSQICDMPTKYIVDKRHIEVLIPSLCCLINDNKYNFDFILNEISPIHIKKYLQTQIQMNSSQNGNSFMRKFSMSSLNSINTQCSSNIVDKTHKSEYELNKRFPSKYWQGLYQSLLNIE